MRLSMRLFFILATLLALSFRFPGTVVKCDAHLPDDVDTDEIDVEDESVVEAAPPEGDVVSTADSAVPTADQLPPPIQTVIRFTRPDLRTVPMEFVAEKPVELLIGFSNRGPDDYYVVEVEASFRYPLSFSHVLQNLTRSPVHRTVHSGTNHTFAYKFKPTEAFSGRQHGLVVNVLYKDALDGESFVTVFNETVKVKENEEEFDREIMSLYFLFIGILAGGVYAAYKYVWVPKFANTRSHIEDEPQVDSKEIDTQWLPKEALRLLNKNGKLKNHKTSKSVKTSKSPRIGKKTN